MKTAILGSGNIGTDLLVKVRRSAYLECALFIGRTLTSKGMHRAIELGVPISDRGIHAIVDEPACCELVFDATSAAAHRHHAPVLRELGKRVIDLTPSQVGEICVPALNLAESAAAQNINMVTCGGQASIPIAHTVAKHHRGVRYIEIVSSIASKSAGPGTRANIDDYIENTESALQKFTRCDQVKAVLILNPAQPCIDMQTTIFAKTEDPDLQQLRAPIAAMAQRIRRYVPGYEIVLGPVYENGRIIVTVRVKGLGDYLPSYAGNLDIINCAAIAAGEQHARNAQASERETTIDAATYPN